MRKTSLWMVFCLTVIVVSVSFLLAAERLAYAEWDGVTLKVCSSFPPPDVGLATHIVVAWEDEVSKLTNGKVKFKNYWGGSLGKGPEQLTLVQNGVVDLTLSFGWYTPGKLPLSNFEYVFPFGPTDALICTKAKRQVFDEFPQFKEELAKYNSMKIYNTPGSVYKILSRDPVHRLTDLNGKKCALVGRYFGRWVEAAGMRAVNAPSWERYTMLETGVIDMTLDPIDLTESTKNYEQARWIIDNPIMRANWNEVWMNKNSFEKLPKDVQKIFIDAAKNIEIRAAKEIIPAWEQKVSENWKTKGLKTTKLSDEDMKKWMSMVEDIPAEWAAEVTKMGLPGWEIVQRYIKVCEELGHQWPRQWGVKK